MFIRIGRWLGRAAPVAVLLATGCASTGATGAAPSTAPFTGFRTSDGFTIAADLDVPGPGPHPLVVLGHQLGTDRHSWDPLVPDLLAAGYAVVRVDHRSFGESRKEVASPAKLTNENKWGLKLDLEEAIDAVADRPGVDASRVAVIGTGLSANAAAQAMVDRPEVKALVVMSGIIQKEEVFQIMQRPDFPVLLVAAANDERSSFVMQRYRGRFLSDVQQYIEFEPIDENDPCDWVGTDGLTPETGLGDLIVWFLQQNFPPDGS